MDTFQTINPFSGEILESHFHLTHSEMSEIVEKAHQSFSIWKKKDPRYRATVLKSIASVLRKNNRPLSQIISREMGKPLQQGRDEVEKCAVTCEYFADQGPEFLKVQTLEGPFEKNQIHLEPQGVILAIMPWNFPLWQAIRFAVPALLAGNTIVLKPSDITAGTSKFLVELLRNVFTHQLLFNAPMDHKSCAEVIAHPLVRGVTFTGSTSAGRQIAEVAGRHLKKSVLELGGSDAYIVLADADLEKAAQICAKSKMVNSGQSCVAGKRFIVEKLVSDRFLDFFKQEMEKFKFGNPMQVDTQLGPLASKKFQKKVADQVEFFKKLGGQIVLGGELPAGEGAFYPATILVFEKNIPELGAEEVFGPVAFVIKAENSAQAIEIANASNYGLGSAIFSANLEVAQTLATQIESGIVVINEQVKSDARLPFGGVKDSGYGRELSVYGLREFCNVKTVGTNS